MDKVMITGLDFNGEDALKQLWFDCQGEKNKYVNELL